MSRTTSPSSTKRLSSKLCTCDGIEPPAASSPIENIVWTAPGVSSSTTDHRRNPTEVDPGGTTRIDLADPSDEVAGAHDPAASCFFFASVSIR